MRFAKPKLLVTWPFIYKSFLTVMYGIVVPKGDKRSNGRGAIFKEMVLCSKTNENYQTDYRSNTKNSKIKFFKVYFCISY